MIQFIAPKSLVVYADDDQDDIELVQEAFRQYAQNVEVMTFSDGSQVLSYLRSLEESNTLPCLIILDINMPVLNGKDTLIRLRQMDYFNESPVVLFTTSSMPVDKEFAARYNAGFITKPLGFEQVEMITKKFIDHCTEATQRKIRRMGN